MGSMSLTQPGSGDTSPYVELERGAWADLAGEAPQPLSQREIDEVRGLGDELDLEEVRKVYVPLAQLISMRIGYAGELYRSTEAFLRRPQPQRTPYVIGIAGSVAVGKSTTARLLRELLAKSPGHSNVSLVTTDGFLLPNAELERRGLLERKGFPESYDRKALLRFVMAVKSGRETVEAPVYSHLSYDVTDEVVTLNRPDVVLIEGLNVLQPARVRGDGRPGLAISDFFDFSVYVDAATAEGTGRLLPCGDGRASEQHQWQRRSWSGERVAYGVECKWRCEGHACQPESGGNSDQQREWLRRARLQERRQRRLQRPKRQWSSLPGRA